MEIQINAVAKKFIFKAPISGTINIKLPWGCIMEDVVSEKFLEALRDISFDGVKIEGYVSVNGKYHYL